MWIVWIPLSILFFIFFQHFTAAEQWNGFKQYLWQFFQYHSIVTIFYINDKIMKVCILHLQVSSMQIDCQISDTLSRHSCVQWKKAHPTTILWIQKRRIYFVCTWIDCQTVECFLFTKLNSLTLLLFLYTVHARSCLVKFHLLFNHTKMLVNSLTTSFFKYFESFTTTQKKCFYKINHFFCNKDWKSLSKNFLYYLILIINKWRN